MDIRIRDLSVSFVTNGQNLAVLKNTSLGLVQGTVTAIIGESGSGKSVLGAALARLLDPQAVISGRILYGDTDLLLLDEPEMSEIRGKSISWMAQNPVSAMDPLQKTGDFVTEILDFRKAFPSERLQEIGIKQLRRFGLQNAETVGQSYPGALSGGMAQRVLISAMTVEEPEWLIADEPTKGLDAMGRRQVYLNLCQLARERRMGMVLITHDLRLAERLSNYIAVMYAGEIVEYAGTGEFFASPGHPYSRGLVAAQPDKDMKPIPGDITDLPASASGCSFAPRCPSFCDRCSEKQKMVEKDSHFVRCWRYVQENGDTFR